jgi:hypothetical protein
MSLPVPQQISSARTPKPRRLRGGQPGNQNALRHGLYAKNLGQVSPSEYDEAEMRNLLGEVAMLKDIMYQLYTKADRCEDTDQLNDILRGLSIAGLSISRLLQTHSRIAIMREGGITYREFVTYLSTMTNNTLNHFSTELAELSHDSEPSENEIAMRKLRDALNEMEMETATED